RRRHTRFSRDWSSDVCSSDLGIANACLLEKRRRDGERVVLTGEDLCNLGPVALLQDLALMALLGIEHVERNGHHYYRGLSLWPEIGRASCRERREESVVAGG